MATGRGSTAKEENLTLKVNGLSNGGSQHKYGNGRINGVKRNGTNGKHETAAKWKDDFYESFEETPLLIAILTYLGYALLVVVGQIRDLLRAYGIEKDKSCTEPKLEGFVPLYQNWESFYTRNVYRRIRDCWNRVVASDPGTMITVMDRISHDHGWTFEYVPTL